MDDKGHIKMKIKDILNIIAEAPAQPAAPTATNAATLKAAQDAAAKGKPGTTAPAQPAAPPAGQVAAAGTKPGGTAGQRPTMANDPRLNGGGVAAQPKPAAKKDPAVEKRQKELNAVGAQLTADGIMGKKTQDAEAQYGKMADAAKGDTATDNAAAIAASNASNAQANAQQRGNEANPTPPADPNAPAQSTTADAPPVGSQGPTAQDAVEKAKIGIMGGQPAPAQATAPNQSPDEIARLQALAGAQPASGGYRGNFSTVASNAQPGDTAGSGSPMFGAKPPQGQAAQPVQQQPAPVSTVQPAVQSASGPVKSGDGSTVKSRSDLEIAWAGLPGNRGKQYPGDAVAQQQVGADTANRQKNMDTLKGVGNKISNFLGGNKQPAQAQPAQAQPAQPNTLQQHYEANPLVRGIAPKTTPAIATFENDELNRLVSLIRHR